MDETKHCGGCDTIKPRSEFHKKASQCKACMCARTKRYRAAHKAQREAYDKQYYQQHKEARSKKHQQYYKENKTKLNAQGHENYLKNRDKYLKQRRQHYKENKEKIALYGMKRHMWVVELRVPLYKQQDKYCNLCERQFRIEDMAMDHIVPASKGGSDNTDNMQLLCQSCNSIKKDNSMDRARKHFKRRQQLLVELKAKYNIEDP